MSAKKKTAAKKAATKKECRVKCRAIETCEVEVMPGRIGTVAKGGTVTCSEATAKVLAGKLEVIGSVD